MGQWVDDRDRPDLTDDEKLARASLATSVAAMEALAVTGVTTPAVSAFTPLAAGLIVVGAAILIDKAADGWVKPQAFRLFGIN